MLFNSFEFLAFFPLVVLFYFVLPLRIRNYWLLIASYFFYMCWNPKYVFLLLASTIITYTSGLLLEAAKQGSSTHIERKKKIIVVFSVSLNLSLLFFFKYLDFSFSILERALYTLHITIHVPTFDILLPVGISFYIFQALSYTLDVYREEIYAEKNFLRYALFVSFFPQLVAGPIERSKHLLRQLAIPQEFNYDNIRAGLLTMLWGYFIKLVIADRCGIYVDWVYRSYNDYTGVQILFANILFGLQIYCDFMGYSIIAKGAAQVLGYQLMSNFEMPYFSLSIKDFWRRWHISLSSWLRDYLYIPLGGNRKGQLAKYRNIIITFLLSGLWHGASLTFVFWGLLHGIYQVLENFIGPSWTRFLKKCHINPQSSCWTTVRIIKTFALVDIAWVFFRAESVSSAFKIIESSLHLSDSIAMITDGSLLNMGLDSRNMFLLLFGAFILFLSSLLRTKGYNLIEWITAQTIVFRYAVYWGLLLLIIFSLDITGQEFIYFQF